VNPRDNTSFRERLSECVARCGGKPNRLAKESGIALTTLLRYFQGSEPSRRNVVSLAQAAGVSVGWLAAGEGLPRRAPAAIERMPPGSDELYVWIPWIGGARGDSSVGYRLCIRKEGILFPRDLFAGTIHIGGEGLMASRVMGFEMEPDLWHGEVYFIDGVDKEARDGIVAVRIREKIVVRRLVQINVETFALRHNQLPFGSEGLRVGGADLGKEIEILGRVVLDLRETGRSFSRLRDDALKQAS